MNRRLVFLFLLLGLTVSAFAQKVEVQIESRTMQEGEPVDMTLVCTNTGEPTAPQFEVPQGLQLQYVTAAPSRSSMVSIVNNRRTESTTYTYALRLTGLRAGSYVIPSTPVQAGGTTYQTNPVPIVVTKPDAEAKKDGDKFVFARIAAQPISLYVTQTVEATLTLAIRKYEQDGQPMDLGNLLQLVDANGSELSVFGTRFNSSEMTLADSQGKRHEYLVYRQTKEIRADQVGTMKVGPVFFKVNYPVSLRRSLFGRYEVAQSRREIARAPAINIEVKGPPEDGRPVDYSGAIGNYQFTVSAKPLRVEQGQPVTLAMVIKGSPLDGVAGPDFKDYPELAARFDFSAEESPGEKENNAKVFRRAIFPRREGEQVIPPISWSYFDPSKEEYVTITSDPIPIIVDPSSSPEAVADVGLDSLNGATKLTRTGGGITPNVVNSARALVDQDVHVHPAVFGAAMIGPPVLCFCAVLVSWRGARLRGDANYSRRRSASRLARSRIRKAAGEPSSATRSDLLAESVTGYIADRFGLPPGALTSAEAERVVAERTGDKGLAAQVGAFLTSCDLARFAGGRAAESSKASDVKQASELVEGIEKRAS